VLAIVAIVALVFAYLLLAPPSSDAFTRLIVQSIPSAVVALIAIPVVYFLFERKGIQWQRYASSGTNADIPRSIIQALEEHHEKLETRICDIAQSPPRGLREFRFSRKNMPSLYDTFSLASSEIVIWGAALEKLRLEFSLITDKLREGCEVKILIMAIQTQKSEDNPHLASHDEVTAVKGTKERLSLSHRDLIAFYESVEDGLKQRLQIRQFTVFHTASYIWDLV
jgi:hypothetical protein